MSESCSQGSAVHLFAYMNPGASLTDVKVSDCPVSHKAETFLLHVTTELLGHDNSQNVDAEVLASYYSN